MTVPDTVASFLVRRGVNWDFCNCGANARHRVQCSNARALAVIPHPRPPSVQRSRAALAQCRMAALLETVLLGKVETSKAVQWLKCGQVGELIAYST